MIFRVFFLISFLLSLSFQPHTNSFFLSILNLFCDFDFDSIIIIIISIPYLRKKLSIFLQFQSPARFKKSTKKSGENQKNFIWKLLPKTFALVRVREACWKNEEKSNSYRTHHTYRKSWARATLQRTCLLWNCCGAIK